MKKILLPVILMCVALSGCEAASVGIIGGADGPTAVYVTDGEEKEVEKTKANVANIEGELYYDTGKTSDAARCGVLDGSLERAAKDFEIPKKSGETNFDGTDGYQFGSAENTMEICIDGKWHIFEKVSENAKKYKYCFFVKGRLPNAATDSEYLVFANETDITLYDAGYTYFGSDMRKMKDIYAVPIER